MGTRTAAAGEAASRDYRRVERAIRFLEGRYTAQPSLEEIAAAAGLSVSRFHRLFRRWAGVTPHEFLRHLTLEHCKERLREGRSVFDAALDAGLSGGGRLHDLFVTFEAVTPGEYRRRGARLAIEAGFHPTPFGECLLAVTPRGICSLHFVGDGGRAGARRRLRGEWPEAEITERPGRTRPLAREIFAPSRRGRPFHLELKGTNFQMRVWRALLDIPPGALVSYRDVAAHLGMPRAARAAGHAIARNPVAYLVPCHRVIAAGGKTHRYGGGAARKKAMIAREAAR